MVAWRMTLHTPEYPDGRDAIVICNDITYQIGSFGPLEDILFLKASQLARELRVSVGAGGVLEVCWGLLSPWGIGVVVGVEI